MQLSLSNASFDSLSISARSSDLPSASSEGMAQNSTAEADSKKPTEFDHLLSPKSGKGKSGGNSSRSARKNPPGVNRRDAATTSDQTAPDASNSPELAAMLALVANPSTDQTAAITLPGLAGVSPGVEGTDGCEGTPPALLGGSGGGLPASGLTGTTVPTALSASSLLGQASLHGQASLLDPATLIAPTATSATTVAAPAASTSTKSTGVELTTPVIEAQTSVATAVTTPVTDPSTSRLPFVAARGERKAGVPVAALDEKAPVASGANIAGLRVDSLRGEKNNGKSFSEDFLGSEGKEVKTGEEELGIDVAKPTVTMAAVPFSHRQSAALEASAVATSVTQTDASTRDVASQLNAAAGLAQRAVDAVMSAAERVSADRTSVNLQFSMGGNDLAVRVEFRGGTVHATFRTDSPELRAALAHEWSAAGSKISDASVRMAPPVFTSSNTGSSTSFSGEGAQHQRDSGARQTAGSFVFNPSRSSTTADANSDDRPVITPARAALSTALHLHTFA